MLHTHTYVYILNMLCTCVIDHCTISLFKKFISIYKRIFLIFKNSRGWLIMFRKAPKSSRHILIIYLIYCFFLQKNLMIFGKLSAAWIYTFLSINARKVNFLLTEASFLFTFKNEKSSFYNNNFLVCCIEIF